MSAVDNGGPAFPCEVGGDPADDQHQTGNYTWQQYGMSLRDYFAAKALAGCFSFWVQVNARTTIGDPDPEAITKLAYEYADAMLKARTPAIPSPTPGAGS